MTSQVAKTSKRWHATSLKIPVSWEPEVLVTAEQERDLLFGVGMDSNDVDNVQCGNFLPTMSPKLQEMVIIRLLRAQQIQIPHSGWFEAQVVGYPTQAKNKRLKRQDMYSRRWVQVKWSDSDVSNGKRNWIDIAQTPWAPHVRLCDDLQDPEAWLQKVARACRDPKHQFPETYLWRFWSEGRWGVTRFSLTPVPVILELQELHEARCFVSSQRDNTGFWAAVNSGKTQVSRTPPRLVAAIQRARAMGAVYISPNGLFAAPSGVVPGELGLFALVLFYPGEFLGNFEGDWLWTPQNGLYGKSPEHRLQPLDAFDNAEALLRYGMQFSNEDTIKGDRKVIKALVDPCRGSTELSIEQVRELNDVFGLVNEPNDGDVANCEVRSHVNTFEPLSSQDRYTLGVVAMLPLLPFHELLIHYGPSYRRKYPVGKKCPRLFNSLNVKMSTRDSWGCGHCGVHQASAKTKASASAKLAEKLRKRPDPDPSCFDLKADGLLNGWNGEWKKQRCGPQWNVISSKVEPEKEVVKRPSLPRGVKVKVEQDDLDPAKTPSHTPSSGSSARAEPKERDIVYIELKHEKDVSVPHDGWFECVLVSMSDLSEVVVRWSDDRVDHGRLSTVNLLIRRWTPALPRSFLNVSKSGGAAAWLRKVAGGFPDGEQGRAHRVVCSRWWTEVRWGFVRIALTPAPVVEVLRERQSARRFISSTLDDDAFWRSVASGSVDLSVGVPASLLAAINEARVRGARSFLKEGLFIAPSLTDLSKMGLFTLILFYPSESIGFFPSQSKTDVRQVMCQCPPFATPNCVAHDFVDVKSKAWMSVIATLPVMPLTELLVSQPEAVEQGLVPRVFEGLSVRRTVD